MAAHASAFCCNFAPESGGLEHKCIRTKADQPSPDLAPVGDPQAQNNVPMRLGLDTLTGMLRAVSDVRCLLLRKPNFHLLCRSPDRAKRRLCELFEVKAGRVESAICQGDGMHPLHREHSQVLASVVVSH